MDLKNGTSYELSYDGEGNLTGYKSDQGLEKTVERTESENWYSENISYAGTDRTTTIYSSGEEDVTQIHTQLPNGMEILLKNGSEGITRYLSDGSERIAQDSKVTDEGGRILELTNLSGNYSYEYDENGNIVSVFHAETPVAGYEYDKNGQLVRYTDSDRGLTHTYEYDDNYNLLGTKTMDESGMRKTFC